MHLTVTQLSKTYKNGVKALDNVDLEISKGMFGLLGPNGAGKSSLMRTIATLQSPDTGSIIFEGIDALNDPLSLRKVLGYLPQEFGVYPKMSAERLLDYFAMLKGIASKKERTRLIQYVLEITNLYEARKKNVDSYSGGMKQRFGIAQLLLNNPRLIIVDEPTAGLDPAERHRFLNVLREIASSNIIIFSTHIVDDVKDLCNDLAIMNAGRVLRKTSIAEASKILEGRLWTIQIKRDDLERMEASHHVLSSKYNQDNTLHLRVFSEQHPGEGFVAATPDLEDLYFFTLHESTQSH